MNVNIMNMCLSWVSIFILWWMWILNILPINFKTILFLVLFVVVAFASSASELTRRKNG